MHPGSTRKRPAMVEPVGADIVAGQDAPFSIPMKGSGRVVRPSTKVRDAALQLESTTERTERPKRSTRNATRATSIDGRSGVALRLSIRTESPNRARTHCQRLISQR